MNNYIFYVADTETTHLDDRLGDVIELSIYRLSDDVQKTWFLKPINPQNIDDASLRINGHKKEDLLHQTKFGKDTYLDSNKVIIDIENWIMEDGVPHSNRILIGHNVSFDRSFLEQLWIKCNSKDSFPFGRRYLDTMVIEIFLDCCKSEMAEGYSLNNLTKKYGVKNEKAHSASADTKATKETFEKQVEFFKKVLKNYQSDKARELSL
jgi:DNA polymerase III epsilon subunit-like protein